MREIGGTKAETKGDEQKSEHLKHFTRGWEIDMDNKWESIPTVVNIK